MKTLPRLALGFLLILAVNAQAKTTPANATDKAAPVVVHYIDPKSIDLKSLLPTPPANGSAETKKEIELILEKEKTRTQADVLRASSEVNLKITAFDDVLGKWFKAKKLPLTNALFKTVTSDTKLVTNPAKKLWSRPRPPLQDKRIIPVVPLEKTPSYPSGHATRGLLYAMILSDLAPDLKDKLIARGQQIGDDRVLAGVHFPSDVEAGRTLAKALYAQFTASPAYQADFAKAKAEFIAARK